MAESTLEARLAALERTVADVQERVAALSGVAPRSKWWEQIGTPEMTDDQERAFHDMVEYGRYFRATGKEAPSDWKPGDPIPEPDTDE